ncbi:MAG: restriction endonuclease subunit S [Candidatus Kapaibacterium sp.]
MREDWVECYFEDLLDYEQPTKYIVKSTKYDDSYKTPVLTAGKSFIKGYTNEKDGIFDNLPTIIFDDFTTATQFVNFKFKVKSSAMKILVPTSQLVNMNFAYFAMQVNQIRNDTHKRYWISVYAKMKFYLPSLLEQRAIVARIEELFSSLDQGIADLKKAQEQLKVYRQAVLKKAFEGELTRKWREKQTNLPTADELLVQIKEERQKHYDKQLEDWKKAVIHWEKKGKEGRKPSRISKPKFIPDVLMGDVENYENIPNSWHWTRFGNVTYKIGDIDHKMPKIQENGLPYISTGNIKSDGTIDFENAKTISKEDFYRLALKIKPEKGDIIFPRYGTIGRNILIDFDKEFLVSYSCAIIKNITKIMDPKFSLYYSVSPVIKEEINKYTVQTTQANIGIASIEVFVYPLCSPAEQHQIVQEIESRLSVCDNVERSIKDSLKKAKALRQSILKKAFDGTLLSAEEIAACKSAPDYEPASVLLEKIRKERKGESIEVEPKKQRVSKKKSKNVSKISTDIQAGLIAKIIKYHESEPKHTDKLSHVKCEKISHLAEFHLQIPLGRVPVKDAAGPDDFNHLKSVQHRAKMTGYFSTIKLDKGETYKSGKNIDKAIERFESMLTAEQKKQFEKIVILFLPFDLERSEIVATLYAGWNNLLLDGKIPSDEEIVYESRENWSKRKLTIDRSRFFKALDWMRREAIGLIPTGYGVKVEKPIILKKGQEIGGSKK